MFLSEPPETNYDLRFSLAGFPVRVHPFFWLAAILLGSGGARGDEAGALLLVWVGVLFGSILVHEMGHALAFRWYGASARIVMYIFGGLAIPDVSRNPWSRPPRLTAGAHMIVSLAGPVAGFVLAAFVVAIVQALGGAVEITPHAFPGWQVLRAPAGNYLVWFAFRQLLWVNVLWGVVNLLPIFPLDGGQITHAYLTTVDPRDGHFKSLQLSFGAALVVAIGGYLATHDLFVALLFGSLAYSNYMAMRSTGGGFGGKPW